MSAKARDFSEKQVTEAIAARDRALSGTPKKVLDAFFPDDIKVAGMKLYPFTVATMMLMEKLENPLIRKGSQSISIDHILRAVIILSVPAEQARQLVLEDPAGFEATVWALADRIAPTELGEIGERISNHLNAAFETVIGKGSTKDKKGLGELQSPDTGSDGPQS